MAGEQETAGGPTGSGPEGLSFEGALEQLEQTVSQLEEGEMPLEAALELFESGVALSRQCATTLEAAERRIEILVADRSGAEPGVEPFEHTDADSELADADDDEYEYEDDDG